MNFASRHGGLSLLLALALAASTVGAAGCARPVNASQPSRPTAAQASAFRRLASAEVAKQYGDQVWVTDVQIVYGRIGSVNTWQTDNTMSYHFALFYRVNGIDLPLVAIYPIDADAYALSSGLPLARAGGPAREALIALAKDTPASAPSANPAPPVLTVFAWDAGADPKLPRGSILWWVGYFDAAAGERNFDGGGAMYVKVPGRPIEMANEGTF